MRSWWPWWARGATSTGTAARPRTQPSPQLDQAAAGDLSFPSGKWRTSALLVDVVAVLRPGRRRQLGLMRVTVEDGDAVSVEDLGVLVDVLAIPVRQPGVFSIGARSPPPRGWSRGAVKGLAQARAGGPGRPGGRGRNRTRSKVVRTTFGATWGVAPGRTAREATTGSAQRLAWLGVRLHTMAGRSPGRPRLSV